MNIDQNTGLIALFGGREAGRLMGAMMEAGFREAGLDYHFATIPVEEGKMEDVVRAAETFHMKGFNLDGPAVREILPYLDMMSPSASISGEVNSVRVQDGMLIGENSIGKGLVSSLMETGFSVQGKTICILGSGRAARAVAVECALSGADRIVLLCRNREEGEKIAWLTSSQTDAAVFAWDWQPGTALPEDSQALINCTPLGLTEASMPDLDYGQIGQGMVVCDMVLGLPDTAFLARCRDRGAVTVAGIDIMTAQASLNFFLWTEAMFPRDLMREVLLEELTGERPGEEPARPDQTGSSDGLSGHDLLIEKMMEYYQGKPGQIQYFLKVYQLADMIGRRERLEEETREILGIAAIFSAMAGGTRVDQVLPRVGRVSGFEGAAEAEALLRRLGYEDMVIDRVLYLLDSCCDKRRPDGPDQQIFREAVCLVRLCDQDPDRETIDRARKEFFSSPSAIRLLDLMFGGPESGK